MNTSKTESEARSVPELSPRNERNREFCKLLQETLALFEQLKDLSHFTEELLMRAQNLEQYLRHQSAMGDHPFRFHVQVPDEIDSHYSRYGHPIGGVKEMEVSDVREIALEKSVFYDPQADYWLVAFGHDLQITPIDIQ